MKPARNKHRVPKSSWPAIIYVLLLAMIGSPAPGSAQNAAPGSAQNAAPPPGEYITERGWGTLQVLPPSGKSTPFMIQSTGSNVHICELQGDIASGRAIIAVDEGQQCIVNFAVGSEGVDVTSNEACRYFCGARAWFDGLYLKPPAGCTGREQAETRGSFKRLYDRKKYAEARTTLEPLLARCGRILTWLDAGWVRKDLALTQHKLGDDRACRSTLKPLAADAAKNDEAIAGAYPPSDAEAYLPIVKATRTNLRLCGAGRTP
jgi:hypothetical protein